MAGLEGGSRFVRRKFGRWRSCWDFLESPLLLTTRPASPNSASLIPLWWSMNSLRRGTSLRLTPWTCPSCARQSALKQSPHSTPRRWASRTTPSKRRLPDGPARTRFAPSPTGSLHLGSIRTALYNYLLARRTKGQFILRIEDTDQKRTVPGAEQRLCEDLQWVGLHWDEGPDGDGAYGPYKQSLRRKLYSEHVDRLLNKDSAYRCFCTAERLDKLNRTRHDRGLPLGYDRRCSSLSKTQSEERAHNGEAFVVRFRAPDRYPQYVDLVYGKTGQGAARLQKNAAPEPVFDDPVLMKTDGFPTYHFANVVDDHLMEITHVIRGSEWMPSTPLHVALYEAFGWDSPSFAHVPLLVDHERQKLSKRNFNSDIATYRDRGIFPDAFVNFAALLGWSHRQTSDVMDLRKLETVFDLKFTKGNTIVSIEKLDYLQAMHAKQKITEGGAAFEQMVRDVAQALLDRHGAGKIMALIGRRKLQDVVMTMLRADSFVYKQASDFAALYDPFFANPLVRPAFQLSNPHVTVPSLGIAAATLAFIPETHWDAQTIRESMMQIHLDQGDVSIKPHKKAMSGLHHYLRWALLGGAPGPSIPQTMEILGREASIERMQSAAQESIDLELAATRPHVEITTQ